MTDAAPGVVYYQVSNFASHYKIQRVYVVNNLYDVILRIVQVLTTTAPGQGDIAD
jgi:hypothetical protein